MTDSQDNRFIKRPEIKEDLLKKELNLPSREARKDTNKEQTRIQTFGKSAVDYNKYLEEKDRVATPKLHRSWVRFKSKDEEQPKPAPKKKPEEPAINRVIKELSPQVLLSIAESKIAKEKKDELRKLFEEIKSELQKMTIQWELVIPVLKNTLDCDLKTAALIVHLTAACQKIWEREQTPNEEQEEQPLSSLFNIIRPKAEEPASDVKE